ncbi:hypothetical protein OROGR_028139 [Orobanche gracilis]
MARSGNFDIERRGNLHEGSPQMRWAFIRKVYCLLCIQLLLTFGVSMAMFLCHPVRDFMQTTAGLLVLIAIAVVAIILLILMLCCMEHHPCNYVLSFLFTLAFAFVVGAACCQRKGENVLLAAGLTLIITVGLTLFTFVAAWGGWDFKFLGPFLFGALLLVASFALFRIFFHVGKIKGQVIACIGTLLFSGYIIYDTHKLIKRFDYDQYIEAAVSLYLDVIGLFLQLLSTND